MKKFLTLSCLFLAIVNEVVAYPNGPYPGQSLSSNYPGQSLSSNAVYGIAVSAVQSKIPYTTLFGGVIYTISATANQTTPSGLNMACMTRKPYQSGYFPLKNIAVSVPGYYQQGNGDISFSNSYTVYASVEYPVGTMTPFTWGGNSNMLVTPGQTNYFSDTLAGLVIPANTNFYIREYATTTNGSLVEASVVSVDNYFNGLGTIGLGGGAIIATDAPNLYLAGTIPDGETYCVAPFSIIAQRADNAITPPISIALRGDSISAASSPQLAGFNYTVNAASVLASAYGIPLMNLATSGNLFHVENTNPINNQLALNSSVVLNCLGVNDCLVQNFDSFSTLTNLAVTGWLNDYKLGKKVYGWTLTPDSSTFPYTNSASLRDTNQEAIRIKYNNWIRTVPWPLSGFIEAAHAVDPNDNGYWNANNTYGDGIHPDQMGEAQIFTNMIPVFQQINLSAGQLTGTNTNPIGAFTNGQPVISAGAFIGNGSGLTNLPMTTNSLEIPLAYSPAEGAPGTNVFVNCAGMINSGKIAFLLVLTNNAQILVTNAAPGLSFSIEYDQPGNWQRWCPTSQFPNGFTFLGTNAGTMSLDIIQACNSGNLQQFSVATNQIP